MNNYSRILTALFLAASALSVGACGGSSSSDDNGKDSGTGSDKDDAGEDSKDDAGEDSKDDDAGDTSDAGTSGDSGSADGGGAVEELDACPKHANVKDDSKLKVCNLVAPKGTEIKTALELKPVKGYKGYVLNGIVYVGEDVGGAATPISGKVQTTLTIAPGTMLAGADPNSGLAINRGSKLQAVGTEDDPIVFTSIKTLAGESGSAPTDWGGVVIMGRAPQNKGDNPITELDTGTYGGVVADDDSGTLKYVRVEFSGSRSSSTKEFNGITFYAVGSKTTVEYIHVHAGSDDPVEFFGGTVNAKHLVLTGNGDDGIDWTDGYKGKIQFVVVQQYPNFGDNGIEANNQETDPAPMPVSEPTLSNITLIGNGTPVTGSAQNGMLLRVGTKAHLHNVIALNFTGGCVTVQNKETASYIGDGLTLDNSSVFCKMNFGALSSDATKGGEDLFKAGTDNMELSNKDVLKGAYETSASYDFTPKDGSSLLSGASVPSDPFFEKVDYIGAFGSENWIKGSWVKIVAFEPK